MKFSIVIPTYNGAAYIEEALLSAISQTRKADAIIVSDDNSTDNTLEICARYKDKISIHKNGNGPSGFVEGWNNAIRLVDDGYIAILHQDDLLAPTFLEEAEKALVLHPDVKHLFTPCNYIDCKGEKLCELTFCDGSLKRYNGLSYVDSYRSIRNPHLHRCPGVVTHRSIFDICTYRKEAGHIADDDFFYRVGQYTDVIGILKPLASYREHDKSETGHIGNVKLVARLANDYLFQVEQSKYNKCISSDTYNFFSYWAQKYVFQEFVYAVINQDEMLLRKSEEHRNKLKYLNVKFELKSRFVYALPKVLGYYLSCKILKMFI